MARGEGVSMVQSVKRDLGDWQRQFANRRPSGRAKRSRGVSLEICSRAGWHHQ